MVTKAREKEITEEKVQAREVDFNQFLLDVNGEKIEQAPSSEDIRKAELAEANGAPGLPVQYVKVGRIAVVGLQSPGKVDPRTGRAEEALDADEKIRRTELALELVAGCKKGDYSKVQLDSDQITTILSAVNTDNDSPFVYYRLKEALGDLK